MPTSPSTSFKLPLRQSVLHDRVERLGLALGAARERTMRASLTSVPGETVPDKVIDGWRHEVSTPSDASASRSFTTPRSMKMCWSSADLFRDDTSMRAVIMNASLISDCGKYSHTDVESRPRKWETFKKSATIRQRLS